MKDTQFITGRLWIRKICKQNAEFIIELLNSPGWLQYIGDRGVKNDEQAVAYILNGPIKSYTEHGYGLYLVEEKESGLPMGLCGLLKRDTLDYPDLGFAFLPEYMGKGYAYEAALSTLEFAKTKLGISILQALVLPENMPSISLLKKLGFLYLRPFRFPEGEELSLYQLNLA